MVDRSELMEAIRSFMEDPEGPPEARAPADESVRMTRSAEARVRVERTGDGERSPRAATLFKATEERPEGFPEDLPFLADQRSLVFVDQSRRMIMWTEAQAQSAEDVLAQSLSAGWTVDDSPRDPDGSGGIRLNRGDDERAILTEIIGVQVVDRLGAGTGPDST